MTDKSNRRWVLVVKIWTGFVQNLRKDGSFQERDILYVHKKSKHSYSGFAFAPYLWKLILAFLEQQLCVIRGCICLLVKSCSSTVMSFTSYGLNMRRCNFLAYTCIYVRALLYIWYVSILMGLCFGEWWCYTFMSKDMVYWT